MLLFVSCSCVFFEKNDNDITNVLVFLSDEQKNIRCWILPKSMGMGMRHVCFLPEKDTWTSMTLRNGQRLYESKKYNI